MIHENLLRYRRARYLWWGLALIAISVAIYAVPPASGARNGGTWQGYTLGTIGALLIVWLAWLGVRKRRYASGAGAVQGWASAHVYLGTALVVTATLHAAFQVGWNVHTLAYALMCGVIVSGFYGVYVYLNHPRVMSQNRAGSSREALFGELFDLDAEGRKLSERCDPEVRVAVETSIARTALGGGVLAQLLGSDGSKFVRGESASSGAISNRDQQPVIDYVADRLPRANKRGEAATLDALLGVLTRRQSVLRRLRTDIRLSAALKVWLYVHVPLSVALLGALVVHVVVTFLYW